MTFSAEIVMRVARALYDHEHASLLEDNARRWALENRDAWLREYWRKAATAALAALPLSPAALEALVKGEAVVEGNALREMLREARELIARAPEETWGYADSDDRYAGWPIRDELVNNIDAALAPSPYRIPPPKEPGNG